MAKSLKTNGMKEISVFKARVIRQHNLGRIGSRDKNELIELIHQIEAKVVKMREEGNDQW